MESRCSNRLKIVALLMMCFTFSLSYAAMQDACDLYYTGDPSELKDSIIRVPTKVVSTSAKIKVDMPFCTTWTIGGTPSIFFLIDHSGSMSSGSNGLDRLGRRFTVAQAMMDTLGKIFPKMEVGIGVFRIYLYFDPIDNARFVQAPGNTIGAYLPFFRFDSSYAPDGKTGYVIAREMLDTVMVSGTADLKYVPTNLATNIGNTNINCGVDAVKHAFQSASVARNRQFVIFFSDGQANTANGPHTNVFDYSQDIPYVSDVPTTFTIYFTNTGTAHQSLVAMTTNIQTNGYSTMNPQTALFPISSDTLMQFVLNTLIRIIVQTGESKPVDITVNGSTVNNWDSINHVFTFGDRFPLTGQSTNFQYKINYLIIRDSIDTITGDTIQVQKDSTDSGSYTILVDPTVIDPPTSPPYKHPFELKCWKRDLGFFYNNAQVNLVNETMNNLELRFIYSPGEEAKYHYTKADIEVVNSMGIIKDKETYHLAKNDTLFTGTFPRVIISSVTNPNLGNGTLQHQVPDTFVATFRNAEPNRLPLDSIWAKVPFKLTGNVNIERGYYYDNTADGYVDSIYIVVTTDLVGGLTNPHVKEIVDSALTLPAFRKFTINSYSVTNGGFYLLVNEDKSTNPTTSVTSNDSLTIKQYIISIGGWVEGPKKAPIYDKVAPIIHWAAKSAFLVDYMTDTASDTLSVRFSEIVRDVASKEPFYLKSLEFNQVYTVRLTPLSRPTPTDKMVFTVDTVYCVSNANIKSMRDGDSIWIFEGNRVGDICLNEQGTETNNYQNNEKNTRRKLWVERKMVQVDLIPNSVSPIDLSNLNNSIIPIDIINTIINDLGQQFFDNLNLQNINGQWSGMLITVMPDLDDLKILPQDYKLRGNITIFDAVGNTVLPRNSMAWDKVKKGLIYIWNAKNSNGRPVGPAMYLALIEIENITKSLGYENGGKKELKRIFVGVKQ